MDGHPNELHLNLPPKIRSPKRRRPAEEIERVWYEYHASFSAAFVQDALRTLDLPPCSVILDPWNGTGITTQVAHREGYRAIGMDLSPVMVLVAKARHLELDTLSDIQELTEEIIEHARRAHEYLCE